MTFVLLLSYSFPWRESSRAPRHAPRASAPATLFARRISVMKVRDVIDLDTSILSRKSQRARLDDTDTARPRRRYPIPGQRRLNEPSPPGQPTRKRQSIDSTILVALARLQEDPPRPAPATSRQGKKRQYGHLNPGIPYIEATARRAGNTTLTGAGSSAARRPTGHAASIPTALWSCPGVDESAPAPRF